MRTVVLVEVAAGDDHGVRSRRDLVRVRARDRARARDRDRARARAGIRRRGGGGRSSRLNQG
jgi:hypothetical protein